MVKLKIRNSSAGNGSGTYLVCLWRSKQWWQSRLSGSDHDTSSLITIGGLRTTEGCVQRGPLRPDLLHIKDPRRLHADQMHLSATPCSDPPTPHSLNADSPSQTKPNREQNDLGRPIMGIWRALSAATGGNNQSRGNGEQVPLWLNPPPTGGLMQS